MNRSGGRGHVFKDPAVKAEMLALRRAGYALVDIGMKYGVDHTTILYHCRIAGLTVFDDAEKKTEMLDLVKGGLCVEDAAIRYGVPVTVIAAHCSRSGITGVKWQHIRKRLNPSLRKKHHVDYDQKGIPLSDRMTERPGWLREYDGTWTCLGKTAKERKQDAERVNKIRLEKRRMEMLTY